MRQAGSKQITFVVQKHLGFINQATKRGGMNYAVAIPLELSSGWSRFFEEPATPGLGGVAGKGGKA
jgi:hypothetical protein